MARYLQYSFFHRSYDICALEIALPYCRDIQFDGRPESHCTWRLTADRSAADCSSAHTEMSGEKTTYIGPASALSEFAETFDVIVINASYSSGVGADEKYRSVDLLSIFRISRALLKKEGRLLLLFEGKYGFDCPGISSLFLYYRKLDKAGFSKIRPFIVRNDFKSVNSLISVSSPPASQYFRTIQHNIGAHRSFPARVAVKLLLWSGLIRFFQEHYLFCAHDD